MAALAVAAISAASAGADASVTSSYNGNGCVVANRDAVGLTFDPGDGGLSCDLWDSDFADSGITVVCPIVKKTSGPGISTGDQISSVVVTINNDDTTPGVQCDVAVFNSVISMSTTPNWLAGAGPTTSAYDATTISFSSISKQGWWGSSSWAYAELECHLMSGEEVVSYTVTESGTAQSTLIYPAAGACSPESGSAPMGTYQTDLDGGHVNGPAGFVEAAGSETSPFFYQCYLPAASE
ncbi:MAG TPA: hypothetical protein VK989_07790, partial [Polyangia bacterium]|nr:hypothetical protein [Polyangia bacterium]